MSELIANTDGPIAELTATAEPAATVLHVAAPAPAALQGGQFRAILGSDQNGEIVLVTAGANTLEWTVTRGAEGTTATQHKAGAPVFHDLTAGGLRAATVTPEALAAETARAEAAETTVAASVTAEVTRAETAETVLGGAITAEVARAETAEALLAPKASPVLTGTPTAPTAGALTNNGQLATTGYTDTAVAVEKARAQTAEAAINSALGAIGTVAPAANGEGVPGAAAQTAALAAAMPAQGNLVLREEAYYVNELPNCGPGQNIKVMGPGTVVYMCGNGVCWRIHNPEMSKGGGEPEFVGNMPNLGGSFVIDGTHAGANAAGLQVGDINCAKIDTIVRHFTGAGGIGVLFKSEVAWCERCEIDATVINCTNAAVWDNGGTGTGSFDSSTFRINVQCNAGQNGFVMQGGIQLLQSTLNLGGGPFFTGEGNTGVVWKLGADNSNVVITGCQMTMQVEIDGSEGQGHKTIEIGTKAEYHGLGVLWFNKGGGNVGWTTGNVSKNLVRFSHGGLIHVDSLLGEAQTGEALTVAGGSTWTLGSQSVAAGALNLGIQSGDYFNPTLANGANALKLKNVYPGAAKRVVLIVTQPAAGEAGTLNLAEPGNNVGGVAQSVSLIGGLTALELQTTNGAVDVLQLVTADGQHWFISKIGSLVNTGGIAAGAVTTAKIANEAVGTAQLAASAVTAAKIAANAVETAGIQAGAVTNAKIAAEAVGEGKIEAGAVSTAKIKAEAVTGEKIAAGAVTEAKLGAEAVTEPKIKAKAVTAAKIANEAIENAHIKAEAVGEGKIENGAVGTTKIKASAVTAEKIGAEAVTAEKIATGAVTEAKLGAGAVSEAKIANGAVSSAKIKAEAVNTEKIAAKAVTAAKLAAPLARPAKPAEKAVTAQAEAHPTSSITFALTGDGAKTEWEVTHNLAALMIAAVTAQAAAGENPAKSLAVSSFTPVSGTVLKVVLGAAPAANEEFFITVSA